MEIPPFFLAGLLHSNLHRLPYVWPSGQSSRACATIGTPQSTATQRALPRHSPSEQTTSDSPRFSSYLSVTVGHTDSEIRLIHLSVNVCNTESLTFSSHLSWLCMYSFTISGRSRIFGGGGGTDATAVRRRQLPDFKD